MKPLAFVKNFSGGVAGPHIECQAVATVLLSQFAHGAVELRADMLAPTLGIHAEVVKIEGAQGWPIISGLLVVELAESIALNKVRFVGSDKNRAAIGMFLDECRKFFVVVFAFVGDEKVRAGGCVYVANLDEQLPDARNVAKRRAADDDSVFHNAGQR